MGGGLETLGIYRDCKEIMGVPTTDKEWLNNSNGSASESVGSAMETQSVFDLKPNQVGLKVIHTFRLRQTSYQFRRQSFKPQIWKMRKNLGSTMVGKGKLVGSSPDTLGFRFRDVRLPRDLSPPFA